ncbi:uncharacterized protein V6R79_013458 [Siganus canaliculatus]
MAGVWRYMVTVVVLMCLLDSTEAVGGAKSRPRPQRRPRKKPKVEPIDVTPPAQNIDMQRITGTWYLLNTASKCSYLINHGSKAEPTVITLTHSSNSDQTLSVSTKTRHDHQCWEILQVYHLSPTPGRLTLKGTRPELNTEIVIKETDYDSYAIMYYQKRGQITMKLYSRFLIFEIYVFWFCYYCMFVLFCFFFKVCDFVLTYAGRSTDELPEPILTKFEELAGKQNMGLAYVFPFPNYSMSSSCETNIACLLY